MTVCEAKEDHCMKDHYVIRFLLVKLLQSIRPNTSRLEEVNARCSTTRRRALSSTADYLLRPRSWRETRRGYWKRHTCILAKKSDVL